MSNRISTYAPTFSAALKRLARRFPVLELSGALAVAVALHGCSRTDSEVVDEAPIATEEVREALKFVDSAGIVSMEAENFTTNLTQGGHSWTLQSVSGTSGGKVMNSTPDNGAAVNTGYTTGSPRLNFEVTFAQTGTYQVWIRGRAGGSAAADSDSIHAGLDGVAVASADRISSFTSSYAWSRATLDGANATLNVTTTGLHTINLWMREDGFLVDKIVLAKDAAYTPTGNGPAETPQSTTCTNGATQTGTTACGPNNRGKLQQQCVSGAWQNTATCIDTDVCTDNSTRAGTTACGFNNRGNLQQRCVTGAWQNTTTCTDPDVCTDSTTRAGSTACGINGRGKLQQQCVTGAWQNTATCSDPDVCLDGNTRQGTAACGLNNRGQLMQQCTAGAWQNSTTCTDPDICVDGSTQPSGGTCGLNGRGSVMQLCTAGVWGASTACADPDVCVDGGSRTGPTACGLNGRGGITQTCNAGAWFNTGSCVDPDVCVDGSTQPGGGSCGLNGRGSVQQLCTAGVWGASTTCSDPDVCVDNATRTGSTTCGLNARGRLQQRCNTGAWGNTATCIDTDVCTDGTTRAGTSPCGLNQNGKLNQTCSTGSWVNSATCIDPDVCANGTTQAGTTPCGAGGKLNRTCSSGQWQDTTTCVLPNSCGNGTCERQKQENCSSCAADCGACLPAAFLEAAGSVSIEAEHFDNRVTNGAPDSWSSATDSNASGAQVMFLGADNGGTYTANVTTSAPRLDYKVNFTTTGTWSLWIRGKSVAANEFSSDSCHAGLDNTPIATFYDFAETGSLNWIKQTFTVSSTGQHTINIWGREDGFSADKIVLSTSSSFTPSGNGPAESTRGDAGFCGDTQCTGTEDCNSCGSDCGSCGFCGDAVCNAGESCGNCAQDCGACPILGLDSRPSNSTCVAPAPLASNYALTNKWPNITFTNPIAMLQPPGDNSRFIVVQRAGVARSVPANATAASQVTNFLSLSNVVTASNGGFLSLAFHPNWATNRYVYVVYTTSNLVKRLSRFQSTDGGVTLNPTTEQVVLSITHLKEFNHNGGQIAFGKDGYLYMSSGDDAYLDYTRARQAANTNNMFGKILRIDVNSGTPYSIPPSNPFVSGGGLPEVYAYGFRNPWRFSFDRVTGNLWEADVGENTWEEINIVTPGFYGWPYFEGDQCFSASTGSDCNTAYTHPLAALGGGGGAASISGGYVYRGSAIPSLYGKYVYGDYVTGTVSFYDQTTSTKSDISGSASGGAVVGFGEGNDGELYAIRYSTGQIHQLVPQSGGGAADFPAQITGTGCFSSTSPTQVTSGVIPFSIAQAFWSDGANKERFIAIPDGTKISVNAAGDWELPPGGVTIKNFRNPNTGLLFETRFFVRHSNGNYAGYSYTWNDAQTQATLVPTQGASRSMPGLEWNYPSRSDCFACHSNAANFTLGPETRQLNIDAFYPQTSRTANEFQTFLGIGMLSGTTTVLPAFPAVSDTSVALETRARAYLHVNCSSCHRPGGTGGGPLDARFDTLLPSKGICNVAPTLGNLGVSNAKLIAPGNHNSSIIWLRMSSRGTPYAMPPLASTLQDATGANLLAQWIDSFTTCP